MTAPRLIAPSFDAVPVVLRERRQWVLWRLVNKAGAKKPTKIPFDPSGAAASSTDAATWSTFDAVRAAYETGGFDGVGFVFSADDPLVGIDLDGCRDATTGELVPWAQAAIARFETYCEISPSGTGIHLIMLGELPPGGRKRGPVECYEQERYFTVTGQCPNGVPAHEVVDCTAALAAWHAEAFPPQGRPARPAPQAPAAPPADTDDDRLLERARGAKNGPKFRALYDGGDCSSYPSQSEAELALCMMLAFWTRRDGARIDRLFRRSALFRPKWDASAGAGQTYGQRTVRKAIDLTTPDRPELLFTGLGGDIPLHELIPPAIEALAARCLASVYARADGLCRVVRVEDPGDDGIVRSAAPRIGPVPDAILRERLDEAASWIAEKKNRQSEVVRLAQWCPRPIVEAVRDRGTWPGLHQLVGTVTAPTMRRDGSILDRPGFDAQTGLLYEPAGSYPPIPEHPSPEAVAAAYRDLLFPFREFPLSMPADEAAIAALMLGLACRYAISGPVPMTVVVAPEFGSGKTLLVEAASTAMTGFVGDVMPPVGGRKSDGEAEMRKRLTTAVMEAPRCVILDNVPDGSTLDSASLATLLTVNHWSDRVLGVNRKVRLPHRIVWVATGNNIRVAGDLARRSLSIQIEPKVERPSLRTFDLDLEEYARQEHPRLLVAALTIARGFVVAGRPGHGRPALGKFTAWDRFVRAAVIWAHRLAGGEADPLDTQARLVSEAPDREVLGELLAAWHAEFGDGTTTAAEAARKMGSGALKDAIVGIGADHRGEPDPRKLGAYLRKAAGRVVDGRTFERRGAPGGTARWGVKVTGDASTRGGDVGVVGVVGALRTPPTFVYARGGHAGTGTGSDPQRSHNSNNSHSVPSAQVLAEPPSAEAVGPLEPPPPRWPVCPTCYRTDREAAAEDGCDYCRQFLQAKGLRPADPRAGPAPGHPEDPRWS